MTESTRRTDATHGYVDWPLGDSRLEDTGEGGLAAYAVWPTSPNEACIPTALCNIEGLKVSEGFEFTKPWRPVWIPTEKRPDKEPRVRPWNRELEEVSDMNIWMKEAKGFLYLGSTGRSLRWKEGGDYYEVGEKDLTTHGLLLLEKLDEHYGTDAKILTFLDT